MLVRVAKLLIRFYSAAISPFLGARCRYHPTCSSYATEALDKHGFFVGLYLAVRRLSSCHALSKRSPYDPVPEQVDWPIALKRWISYISCSSK